MEMPTVLIEEKNSTLGAKLSEIFLYGKSIVPALLVLLVILVAFFGLMTPYFFKYTNFKAIISNIPIIAIMAIGMAFVLLIGGLDMLAPSWGSQP